MQYFGDHEKVRREIEEFLVLSFKERAAIYDDEEARLTIAGNVWAILLCKRDNECLELGPKLENLEHNSSCVFLKEYIEKGPAERFKMSSQAARSAMRHVYACVGHPQCGETYAILSKSVEEDNHLDSMLSAIRKELQGTTTPQDILDAKEDMGRRNSEEWL